MGLHTLGLFIEAPPTPVEMNYLGVFHAKFVNASLSAQKGFQVIRTASAYVDPPVTPGVEEPVSFESIASIVTGAYGSTIPTDKESLNVKELIRIERQKALEQALHLNIRELMEQNPLKEEIFTEGSFPSLEKGHGWANCAEHGCWGWFLM